MKILWKYMKPQRWLIFIALLLAGISQLLNLVDPLIFGKIIDDYATHPGLRSEEELVKGVLLWLGVAIAIAIFVPRHEIHTGIFYPPCRSEIRNADF